MAIDYFFLKESDICFARYSGRIDISDIIKNYEKYITDSYYRAGRSELIDLTECELGEENFGILGPVANYVDRANTVFRATTLTSLYAPGDIALEIAMEYQRICRDLDWISVVVAKSQREALENLALPYPDFATLLKSETVVKPSGAR